MQRPDMIIEIHRERFQGQTVELFGGDTYTESIKGPGYSATATMASQRRARRNRPL